MAFRRNDTHPLSLDDAALTAALVGIGINFGGIGAINPNIEDTLILASIQGMEHDDLRIVAALVSWFGLHHAAINASRFNQLVSAQSSIRVRALWQSLATWQCQDRRFTEFVKVKGKKRIDLLSTGTAFHVGRHGEDERFARTPLRVPANVLRDRKADVLTPYQLARQHAGYRNRIMIGPGYRADLWTELVSRPTLTASELARRTYSSFASAWQIKRDFAKIMSANE
jgi:hypothetical protein